MAQVLQLTFVNELGKTMTINIQNPKANLTESEVNTAMQTIIDQAVFTKDGLVFNAKKSAKLIDREVTEFDVIS